MSIRKGTNQWIVGEKVTQADLNETIKTHVSDAAPAYSNEGDFWFKKTSIKSTLKSEFSTAFTDLSSPAKIINGNYVYVGQTNTNNIYVYLLDSANSMLSYVFKITLPVGVYANTGAIDVSADNTQFYIIASNNNLYYANITTKADTTLTLCNLAGLLLNNYGMYVDWTINAMLVRGNDSKYRLYNIANKTGPTLTQTDAAAEGWPYWSSIYRKGNYLYIVNYANLKVFDLSSAPSSYSVVYNSNVFTQTGSANTNNLKGVELENNKILMSTVGNDTNSLCLINISTPSSPSIIDITFQDAPSNFGETYIFDLYHSFYNRNINYTTEKTIFGINPNNNSYLYKWTYTDGQTTLNHNNYIISENLSGSMRLMSNLFFNRNSSTYRPFVYKISDFTYNLLSKIEDFWIKIF